MRRWPTPVNTPFDTLLTLAVGAVGAGVGWAVNAPIYMLIGPVVAVSLVGLAGARTAVHPLIRDLCFLIVGLAVGSGFNRDALGTMIRWPLAFVGIAVLILVIMVVSQWTLKRFFRYDARAALLASAPGHLSFVIAMAADAGADVARISMTQSVRVLLLTLTVPYVAIYMGYDLAGAVAPTGAPIDPVALAVLFVLAIFAGQLFKRLHVPAPLLLGAMTVSALGHLTELADGVMPAGVILPAYLVLGSLIGTRFSGVGLGLFLNGLAAGVVITLIAVGAAVLGSVPIALALEMPLAHVLVALAPGGLETMIAMGVVLSVVPGFVAACHIMRLLVLSVLLPVMLARIDRGRVD